MNYFLKYRAAIWTIIILSVIVLSSLGTVFFLKFTNPGRPFRNDEANRRNQIELFLKKELKLSPAQEEKFKASRKEFFKNSRAIFDSLEKKRIVMIQEFSKTDPDTAVLYKISDEMGTLHTKFKYETVKHVFALRNICSTPEQLSKLTILYKDLIKPEGPMRRMKAHREYPNNNKPKPN